MNVEKMIGRLKELLTAKGEDPDIYIHNTEWFRGTFRIRYRYDTKSIYGHEQQFTEQQVNMSDEDWQSYSNKLK